VEGCSRGLGHEETPWVCALSTSPAHPTPPCARRSRRLPHTPARLSEALGAIGTSECVDFLKAYEQDPVVMLKESCQVALDCVDYWNAFKKEDGDEAAAGAADGAAAPVGEVSA
jgi:hypothetical protein